MAADKAPRRADARRNYERLVSVADAVIAEQGADASLEEIARRAGVGSATLHRHFPGRQALLEAVFEGRVDSLCVEAADLFAEPDAGAALFGWLHAVVNHAAANRGLGAALMAGPSGAELGSKFHQSIRAAGERLLLRAQQANAVRPDIVVTELLRLVNAIALAAEGEPELAGRLLDLLVNGLRQADEDHGAHG